MALSVEPVDQGPQLDSSMRVIREGRGRHNHVGPIVYSIFLPKTFGAPAGVPRIYSLNYSPGTELPLCIILVALKDYIQKMGIWFSVCVHACVHAHTCISA